MKHRTTDLPPTYLPSIARRRVTLWLLRCEVLPGAMALLAPSSYCQCPTTLYTIYGAGAPDGFGTSVGAIGDINGDGKTDLIVGAPYTGIAGASNAGQVNLLSGATGSALFTLAGSSQDEYFGYDVDGIGDVDGDAVPDFVVGAPGAAPGGMTYTGRAHVYSGATASPLYTLNGPGPLSWFANFLSAAGDVNNDGIPDLIIGAPNASPGGSTSAGQATVHSGSDGTPLLTFNGAAPADSLGYAPCAVGDIDADGHDDLLVCAPHSDPFGLQEAGTAYIRSGSSGSLLAQFPGLIPQRRLGYSGAGLGDINNDGVPDFMVGAPGAFAGSVPGQAVVFSGANGTTLFVLNGTTPGDWFGISVAGLGDVTGDGTGDFVVGNHYGTPGGVYAAGTATVFTGASGGVLAVLAGASPNQQFGFSVASAGDVNVDGWPDLVVGSRTLTATSAVGAGSASVFAFVGQTPSFGSGCPGAGGFIPTISVQGCPTLGNPFFGATVGNALGGSLVVLILGASTTSWGPASLPLNLAFVGMPGCNLLVSGDVLYPAIAGGTGIGGGSASFALPIPMNPALVGGTVHLQGWASAFGVSLFPAGLSEGVHVTIIP